MRNIPKLFTKGIRIPGGKHMGALALPCPCGRPVDLEGSRELYLAELGDGTLCFFHADCAQGVEPEDD